MGLKQTVLKENDFLLKNIQDNSGMTVEDYCQFIHGEKNDGYVTVTTKDKNGCWTENNYSVNTWFNHIDTDREGCFSSLATFFIPRRNTKTIREISMVYVDLDTRDAGISNEECIEQIDFLVESERLPEPTMIVKSGGSRGGLYALWKIESVPGKFKRVRELYKYVEETLINELAELGADTQASDATRVLRLPGSVNEKYDEEVRVVRFNPENYYTLRFFQEFSNEIQGIDWEEVQQDIKERKKKRREEKKKKKEKNKNKTTKITRLFNRYTLSIARAKDFEKLIELRDYDMTSLANAVLHMYAIEQMKIHKDKLVMKDKLSEFNSKLKNSHDKKDIQYVSDSVSRYYEDWNYYNSTIISKLKITEEEMKHMSTLINKKEKNERDKRRKQKERRNKEGLTSREQSKINLISAVKELNTQGLKQVEIAKKLNVSKGRISQIMRDLKNT